MRVDKLSSGHSSVAHGLSPAFHCASACGASQPSTRHNTSYHAYMICLINRRTGRDDVTAATNSADGRLTGEKRGICLRFILMLMCPSINNGDSAIHTTRHSAARELTSFHARIGGTAGRIYFIVCACERYQQFTYTLVCLSCLDGACSTNSKNRSSLRQTNWELAQRWYEVGWCCCRNHAER